MSKNIASAIATTMTFEVSIAGNPIGRVTLSEAEKLQSIILGMIAERSSDGSTVATTPAQPSKKAEKPADTPKEYKPAEATEVKFARKDNVVSYTTLDGKFVHHNDVRQVVNARIKAWAKDNGFTVEYDKDLRGWVFTKGEKRSIKGATAFVESAVTIVTAEERQSRRDGWAERKARKASNN